MEFYRRRVSEQEAFERDIYTPVGDEVCAVRDQWPVHYDFDSDAAAKAQLAEVHSRYNPVEDRFDELVDRAATARHLVLTTPAMRLEDVATKI